MLFNHGFLNHTTTQSNTLMKIGINFIKLKLESFKNMGLGVKIAIFGAIAILAQAFGIIFL